MCQIQPQGLCFLSSLSMLIQWFCLGRASSPSWSLSDSRQTEPWGLVFECQSIGDDWSWWSSALTNVLSQFLQESSCSPPSFPKHRHTSMYYNVYLPIINTANHPSTGYSLLRLLLVVFDCLRKLMLVIISMEPKTVTMSLLCTVVALFAQSNEYSRTGVYGSTLLDQASFMECIPFLPAMPADAPQHFIRVLGMHVGLEVSYLSCHSRLICSSHCHQAEASYHKCWCLIPTVSKPSW